MPSLPETKQHLWSFPLHLTANSSTSHTVRYILNKSRRNKNVSNRTLLCCRPLYVTVVYQGKCSHCMRIGVAVPLSGAVSRLRQAVAQETKIPVQQVLPSLKLLCLKTNAQKHAETQKKSHTHWFYTFFGVKKKQFTKIKNSKQKFSFK